LDATPGHDFLLAETGPEMAKCIEDIERDELRRNAIGRRARQTALGFDWNAIARRQLELYDRLESAIR